MVAFVEGLSPEQPDKVAYVTHVPSGSQAVLDRDGQIIDRHDGRGDGPGRLDAVLEDGAEMDRILKGLKSDEDVRPRETVIDWVPLIQFGGIHYLARWRLAGQTPREGDRDLTVEDLGREFYRIAFRGDGYVGGHYRYQDGDSTRLDEIKNLHLEVQAGGVVRGLTPTRRARACHERRGQACWRRMLRPEGPLLPTAGAFGWCRLAAPSSWIGRQDVSRAPPELGEL